MPAVPTPAPLCVCLLAGLLWQPVAASVLLTSSDRLETAVSETAAFDTPNIAIDPLAPDFLPGHSQQIHFGTQTQIQYDSIRIDSGITIDLDAPTGTALTLISNGDIVIDGDLNWLDGTLSLISLAGEFTLQGTISAGAIHLTAGRVQLTDTAGRVSDGRSDIERIAGSDISLSGEGNLTLRPVPLPGAFWLLLSGLIPATMACRRSPRSCVPATA